MRILWTIGLCSLFGAGCYTMAAGAVVGRVTLVLAGCAFSLVASVALALSGPRT